MPCSWSYADVGSSMQHGGRTETAKTVLFVIGRVLRTVFLGVYSPALKLRIRLPNQVGRV